jgi:DNA-binding transcriptional ArsR family regulator
MPTPHQRLSPAQLEAVARRFAALSAPSRLAVVDALMAKPLSMGELQQATGLGQSNLSRQVAELENAGCVRRRREGRGVMVEIADPTLYEICGLVCAAVTRHAEAQSRELRELRRRRRA